MQPRHAFCCSRVVQLVGVFRPLRYVFCGHGRDHYVLFCGHDHYVVCFAIMVIIITWFCGHGHDHYVVLRSWS